LQQDYQRDAADLAALLGGAVSYDIALVVSGDYRVVARLDKTALEAIGKPTSR
jgi:hypothetical protein